MRRRLVNLAAGVSLVLCVTVVALWIRSVGTLDFIAYMTPIGAESRNYYTFSVYQGGVRLGWYHFEFSPRDRDAYTTWEKRSSPPSGLKIEHRRIAHPTTGPSPHPFTYNTSSGTMGAWGNAALFRRTFRVLSFPLWSLMVLLLPLPVVVCLRWRAQRRRKGLGQCARCGYDLRATPERCPECGTIPAQQRA